MRYIYGKHHFPPMRFRHLLLILLSTISSCSSTKVSGIATHRVPLRRQDPKSPFCLAVSSPTDVMDRPDINFLATQVWPSARVAALALERNLNPDLTVCEFGCGPGLPSLTAASIGAKYVYATDLDLFALKLVDQAAKEQGLSERIETRDFDLVQDDEIPLADLYIFSDVFESSVVASGAARISRKALKQGSRVWVFAQSDRAQREVYLEEMKKLLEDPSLDWQASDNIQAESKLWLSDIDERNVCYG